VRKCGGKKRGRWNEGWGGKEKWNFREGGGGELGVDLKKTQERVNHGKEQRHVIMGAPNLTHGRVRVF